MSVETKSIGAKGHKCTVRKFRIPPQSVLREVSRMAQCNHGHSHASDILSAFRKNFLLLMTIYSPSHMDTNTASCDPIELRTLALYGEKNEII